MMSNTIEAVISSTLLHLYGKVESIKRSTGYKHVPTDKRDAICAAYLKGQLKLKKNQQVKKKIKKIISAKRKVPIEHYLTELNLRSQDVNESDVDRLYSILEVLEKEGISTFMLEEVNVFELGSIYISRENIGECFDDSNHQVSLFPVRMKKDSFNIVEEIIQEKTPGRIVSSEEDGVYLISTGDI